MDWTRAELLNPQSIKTVARYLPAAGTDDPVWDSDNDLSFSDNGVRLTFDKPISGYAWIEITLVNIDVPASINPRISCLVFPTSGGIAVGAATTGNVPVAAFSEFVLKIPVVQQIEELAFTPVFPLGGKRVAIKKIQVLVDDSRYEKTKNNARLTVTMPGFLYDPINDIYTCNLLSGAQSVGSFSCTPLALGVEYLHVRVSTLYNSPSPLVITPWENNQSYSGESGFFEMAISGDLVANPLPKSLTIWNVDGFQISKVKLEFFIGRFQENVSAFGNQVQPSTAQAPVFSPYAIDFLNQNNTWNGINTFNAQVNLNNNVVFNSTLSMPGILNIGALGGWLKAANVTGNITANLAIPYTDISGLGTMANQNHPAVNIDGGTIDGCAINASSIGATTPSTIIGTSILASGVFVAFLGVTLGFYTAVNAASSTYQMILNGTADTYIGGSLGFGDYSPLANNAIVSLSKTHTAVGVSGYAFSSFLVGPSTMTGLLAGFYSVLQSSAVAYTLGIVSHFNAGATVKGAGSTITNNYGFIASVTLPVVGANNYGFFSALTAGANTYNFYASGTALNFFGGEVGVKFNPTTDRALYIGAPSSTGVTLVGANANVTAQTTTTSFLEGFQSDLNTVASVFTLTSAFHFLANSTSKGAGSTITSVMGFYASNGIATAINNYGFYSNIALASTTYQLYMAGTAQSVFAGPVGFGVGAVDAANAQGAFVLVGLTGNHPSANGQVFGVKLDYTAPATATTLATGYDCIMRTANSAFTEPNLVHFYARAAAKGAASTLTNVRGFWADAAIAVGSNNYGFYSNINVASNTYQFYGGGNAESFLSGSLTISNAGNGQLYYFGTTGTHQNAGVTIYGIQVDVLIPATATSAYYNNRSVIRTTNSAFTAAILIHFMAEQTIKGAASTITAVRGFVANNSIVAAGATVEGFYSDIAAASNVRQLYMAGTAESRFNGPLVMSGAALISARVTETYSASITSNAALGDTRVITVTNGVAFTINNPTNPATGQRILYIIKNTSGGAMGAITWGANMKVAGWVNPATAFNRSIEFEYDGTNWLTIDMMTVDIPN